MGKKKKIAPLQKKVGWVWRSYTEDDSAESREGHDLLGSKGIAHQVHMTNSDQNFLRSVAYTLEVTA